MARALTLGQRAAVRAAINRRGVLGLTQEELAERSHVSARTISNFEGGHAWPNARTMGQIERLGLNWVVGHLRELADEIDYPPDAEPEMTEDEAQIILAAVRRRIALLEESAKTQRERAVLEELREVVDGH